MASSLSAAERELLAIYTRQAYDSYLSENLRDTQQRISQIEALNPGDIHARFLVAGEHQRQGVAEDVEYSVALLEMAGGVIGEHRVVVQGFCRAEA